MGTPLRGELTHTTSSSSQPSIQQNLESIQGLLSRFVQLSAEPNVTIVPPQAPAEDSQQSAAAPWTWTAAEVASTEASLLPSLFHLATAKGDIAALKSCLASGNEGEDRMSADPQAVIAGGLVNHTEPGSGRSPLHVAAINGSALVIEFLLHFGALVHLRDLLGHTPLYYVSAFAVGLHTRIILQLTRSTGCSTRS